MTEIAEVRQWGALLIKHLGLASRPLGLKLISSSEEIPDGALRPKKDKGQHLAQCQAFALTRRQGLTVAMTLPDHWCWGPLVGYGLVDRQPAFEIPATRHQAEILPSLDQGRFIGLVSGPLDAITFMPDLALVYSNPAQLRSMLMALSFSGEDLVSSQFDPIDSCVYSVVPTFKERKIRITLPDPGESHRATAQDDEIILSLPLEKIGLLAGALERFHTYLGPGQPVSETNMIPDFPRPDFYRQLFEKWGLEG